MNHQHDFNLIDRLTLLRLAQRHKPGDYLVLDDATLRAALDNTRPLLHAEWRALIDSPLTLKRVGHLLGQSAQSAGISKPQPGSLPAPQAKAIAANDAVFATSTTMLRAAAGVHPAPTLTSDDGRWTITFGRDGARWHMVLTLNPDDQDADVWMAARPTVAVLDGAGNTLLLGELDDDGEVEGPWRPEVAPLAYLASHGGLWQVVRA